MSGKRPTDLKQDRRQWLKTSATILGSSLVPISVVSPPAILAETAAPKKEAAPSSARFLTPAQHRLVEEVTETIIPADSHSGGAKAAKVADYVEKTLSESLDSNSRTDFREGLRLVDLMCQHYGGKSFVDATPEDRIAVLTILSENGSSTDLPEIRFFHHIRALTIHGYYSSKIGIHDDQEYKGNVMIAEYVGCDDPPASSST
jgi:Gluconate 2-dehydrogenase subunit 3